MKNLSMVVRQSPLTTAGNLASVVSILGNVSSLSLASHLRVSSSTMEVRSASAWMFILHVWSHSRNKSLSWCVTNEKAERTMVFVWVFCFLFKYQGLMGSTMLVQSERRLPLGRLFEQRPAGRKGWSSALCDWYSVIEISNFVCLFAICNCPSCDHKLWP